MDELVLAGGGLGREAEVVTSRDEEASRLPLRCEPLDLVLERQGGR
jgi:hypothetical protein